MRHCLLVAVTGALFWTGPVAAALHDEIITEATAQRYGLTRMWVAQAQVNRAQGQLQGLTLCDGVLYAQSNRATLEAIDAETGQEMWGKMIGSPEHPSLPPTASRDLVATINGSTLFVMNRYSGDILYQTTVSGAPGGGPTLSSWIARPHSPTPARAYVPMVSGMLLAYRLDPIADASRELGKIDPHAADMTDEEKKEAAKKAEEDRRENIRINQAYSPPLACASAGRVLVPPLVTTQNSDEEFVSWVTDRGYLYLGRIDRRSEDKFISRYRIQTNGSFNSPPAYLPPNPKVLGDSGVIFAGSSDGYVYAVLERAGEIQWKFSAGDPIVDSPVLIEDRLYVATELGGMFCLKVKDGKQMWFAPEAVHFVAAGKQRVYAADKLGRLRVLDARNGATVQSLPTSDMPIKVSNGRTDRIYLATEGGLIQCLREVEQVAPIAYNESRKPPPEDESDKGPPKLKHTAAAAKPAAPAHVAPKKPAAKKDDAAGFGDADADAKPAKPAKGKAKAAAKAAKAAKAKKNADADAGGGDPFGGN